MARLGRVGVGGRWALWGLVAGCLALWSCGGSPEPASEEQEAASPSSPPNVVLIVIDTLRADRLGFYGHSRDTSPRMDALLAERGTVIEHAYAQAPWTIPSVASLLTGMDPALFLDDNDEPWGLPEGAVTVAERLRDAGYDTRAFIANPTLHAGNGFDQGFDHFETAPYDVASLRRHAGDLDARVRPRLAELEEPFFLYVHYLDPHDPYENPDLVDGRSEFFPEYEGKIRGTDVHGLYLGQVALEDPEQDLRQIRALYDSEIRHVDGYVGRLLEALAEKEGLEGTALENTLENTLVVLTSDHGEELYDHGGWKHGESVYEEQIRVPLVFRWDGRVPAGRRLERTARLLDVTPTLLEATGLDPTGTDGRSLWSALLGEEDAGPEPPAYARHHAGGPLRLAAVHGRQKVVLFDREADFEPSSDREELFLRRDRARMSRLEIYDLASDAGETRNLADAGGKRALAALDPHLEGLRMFTAGFRRGRVEGKLELGRAPRRIRQWFLGPEDLVELEGATVRFSWTGDGVDKGITVEGAVGEIRFLRVDGLEVRWAGRADAPDLPAGLRAVRADRLPLLEVDEPSLHLWIREPRPRVGEGGRDEETLKRLKALGYAD